MITEQDLQEAIAECQGVRSPTANTCIKLAAFLTIQREMFGEERLVDTNKTSRSGYSYAAPLAESAIQYNGETEFAEAVNGKDPGKVWPIMDELMTAVKVLNSPLYAGVMRKLRE